MESPFYEMTHDFQEESRMFQSGYLKGYHDAVMKNPEIVRCKNCKHGEKVQTFKYYPDVTWCNKHSTSRNDDWFCADGEGR